MIVKPAGANNDLMFTALDVGAAANTYKIQLIDDGTITDGTAAANFSGTTLTINIQNGVTTANQVLSAVGTQSMPKSENKVYASLSTTDTSNSGNGTIHTASVTTAGGVDGVLASATVAGLTISAKASNSGLNNVRVYLYADGAVTDGGNPIPAYDRTNKLLQIHLLSEDTQPSDIAVVLNSASATYSGNAEFRADFLASSTSDGAITVPFDVTKNGTATDKATATVGNVTITADAVGADFNGYVFYLFDDGTVTDGRKPIPSYDRDRTAKLLSVNIKSGDTSANDIRGVLNAANATYTGASDFRADFTATSTSNDALVVPTTTTAGGVDAVKAMVKLQPLGEKNDIRFTATSAGTASNGIKIRLIDSGSLTTNTATATYLATSKTLTINIANGITTASSILTAVNGMSSPIVVASLDVTESGATNDGSGTIHTAAGMLSAGSDASFANVTIMPPGINNDLLLTARSFGDSFTNNDVIFENAGNAGDEKVLYDGANKTLTIRIESGVTSSNQVIAALASEDRSSLTSTTAGGTASTKSKAIILPAGANNDFQIVAKNNGTTSNGIGVTIIHDASLSGNSATAQYSSQKLVIRIRSGVTTANTIIGVLNATNDQDFVSGRTAFQNLFIAELNKDNEIANTGAGTIDTRAFSGTLFQGTETTNNGTGVIDTKSVDMTGSLALVKDLNTGSSSSSPSDLFVFANRLYFTATDGPEVVGGAGATHGRELWSIDLSAGPGAEPMLVKDIAASGDAFTEGQPTPYAIFGNKLYFVANDGVNGAELWSTDGTETGTTLAAEILVGTNSSAPREL
ncbi:MAG: hypothetical protein ACKOUR_20385, partial [Planctomycetota bacterium]